MFTLSRVVRTFGTEGAESARYLGWLRRLTLISNRQAAAYFMYLTTNSGFWYLAKARLRCVLQALDVLAPDFMRPPAS